MKKLLFILLLTIPFVGFGQGWDFKLGTNLLIPFSNTIKTFPYVNGGPIIEHTTKIGLNSSVSYEYFVNEKFSFYPSISYSFINYKTNESVGIFDGKYNNNDYFINISINPGYRINNKFHIYFGLSFDSKIKSTKNGTVTRTNVGSESLPTQDSIPTTQSYNWTSSNIQLFYLSNEISLKYYIKNNIFIFSNLKIPLIYYDNFHYEFSWKKNENEIETSDYWYHRNRYIVIGVGYCLNNLKS